MTSNVSTVSGLKFDIDVGNTTNSLLITGQVVNAILLLTTAWILLSMIVDGTKSGKWKKGSGASSLHSGMIYVACVGAVFLTIPKLTVQTVNFAMHRNGIISATLCELIMDIYIVLASISVYSIYFILWLRQRVIYQHPSVRELNGVCVNILSCVSLLGSTIVFGGFIGFFVFPTSYELTKYGCLMTFDKSAVPKNILLAVLSFFSELLLLGLFLYPIVHANRPRDESDLNAVIPDPARSKFKENISLAWKALAGTTTGVSSPIAQTIRRSAISSIITFVTDVLAMVITYSIPMTVPRLVTLTIYDVNNLINLFCAIATFRNAGSILAVICLSMDCLTVTSTSSGGSSTVMDHDRTSTIMQPEYVKQESTTTTNTDM